MPPCSRLKINFDGAWCEDSLVGCLGVIVRDDRAEDMATRACSVWTYSRGFRNFLLEKFSLQIMTSFCDTSTNMSSTIGQLV
ncbi:unnamed protein product [Malus baccata var. baccata]